MACLTQAPFASATFGGVRSGVGLWSLVFGLWSLTAPFSGVPIVTGALLTGSAGVSPAAVTK
jgi:hypothetical protein